MLKHDAMQLLCLLAVSGSLLQAQGCGRAASHVVSSTAGQAGSAAHDPMSERPSVDQSASPDTPEAMQLAKDDRTRSPVEDAGTAGRLAAEGGSPATAGSAAGASAGHSGAGAATASSVPPSPSPSREPPALSLDGLDRPMQIQTSTRFTLAEGPLWDHCSHQLLFVDVNASTIYALSSDDKLSVFATDTHNTNGIAFANDGSLILAQMAPPGHIARRDKSGQITLIDPPGPPLHTPDDVTVRSDGTIYFTDGEFPPVGTLNLGPLPVYGFAPGDSMLTKGGTVAGPNGIELSADEKTLYVDAYYEGSVVQFSVAADGKLTKGKALATGLTNPDSLCLDAAGNLYVGVSTGLQVLRPDGSRVGLIPIRSVQGTTNCTFGGEDGKTLFITAWTGIWKLPNMPIPGLAWQADRQRVQCTP